MRSVSRSQRRRILVRRHHHDGLASCPEHVARALVGLHATDPATVFLSVLARSRATTLADISAAMYQRRTLVRWMAMRRTLLVFPVDDVPVAQSAISDELATTLQRALVARLTRNGTEPALEEDPAGWLHQTGERVEEVLRSLGSATGAELSAQIPALRTRILARTPSDRPQLLTTSLLTQLSTAGRLVRSTPTGSWTSRGHRWEPVEAWWPDGLPRLDPAQARTELARRYLACYGPTRPEDLQWWTGWSKRTVRTTLADLDADLEQVDLHGTPGIALTGDLDHQLDSDSDSNSDSDSEGGSENNSPAAVLLPSLDPTPMGWKAREWFTADDLDGLYDRAGNIGPTVWWNGELIGSWAMTRTGDLRTDLPVDRGSSARDAVEVAAAQLHRRLEGAIVTPAARTPRERALAES